MACDDLLGLLDLSDVEEEELIVPQPKPKLTKKASANKSKKRTKDKLPSLSSTSSSKSGTNGKNRKKEKDKGKQNKKTSPKDLTIPKKRKSILSNKSRPTTPSSKTSSPKKSKDKDRDRDTTSKPSKSRRNSKKLKEKPSSKTTDSMKQNKKRNSASSSDKNINKIRRESKKFKDDEKSSTSSSNSKPSKRSKRASKIFDENETTNILKSRPSSSRKSNSSDRSGRRKSRKTDPESLKKSMNNRKKVKKIDINASPRKKSNSSSSSASKSPKTPKLDKSATSSKTHQVGIVKSNKRLSRKFPRQQTTPVGVDANGEYLTFPSTKKQESIPSASLTNAVKTYEKRKSRNLKAPPIASSSSNKDKERKSRKSIHEFFPERPKSKSPNPVGSNLGIPGKKNGLGSRQSRKSEYVHPDRPRSKSPMLNSMQPERPRSKSPMTMRPRSMSPMAEYRRNKAENEPEIDETTLRRILDNMKRNQWRVGSKVEVFSVSQSMWMQAIVIRITKDYQGEWLLVMYDEKQKTLSRYGDHIRPLKKENDEIDLDDEKVREKAAQYIKRNMKEEQDANSNWYVGQKCEIQDPKVGWTWCEILETFKDNKGEWVKVEYKVYDYKSMDAQYRRYNMPMGCPELRASLPVDIGPTLYGKWQKLCQRIDQYPEESVIEHVEKRYIHIKTMADLYKSQHIESYEKIPPTIAQFMKVQNIKILPILIMDLENTLFPSRLIRTIKRKNEIEDSRQLFRNFDRWCYDGDYKYLKQLQRIMYQTAHTMAGLLNQFRGKMCIIAENGYSQWNTIINDISETAGGDLWRDVYRKSLKDNSRLELFSAKSVYYKENNISNNKWDEDDIVDAKQLIMERYLESIQMECEFMRLKSEEYFIPVIFSVGDDSSDMDAIDGAAQNIFKNFYRLVSYQLVDNKNRIKIGDNTDTSAVKESLNTLINHPLISYFMRDNKDSKYENNNLFAKETWHGLFSTQNESIHQLIKLNNKKSNNNQDNIY